MKKGYFKKIAGCLFAGLIFLCGCVNTPNSNESSSGSSTDISVVNRETFNEGVHQYNYTETSYVVAKDGQTNYKIVIENNAPEEILFATTELQTMFAEATGAMLSVAYANSVDYSENAEFIVLGKNSVFVEAGLSRDGLGLGFNGYVIKTRGKSIFIAGDDVYGTLFGMYQFLTMEYNFDCFANDCYVIDKKAITTLKNFDVLDIPDIDIRSIGESNMAGKDALKRMRFVPRGEELFAGTVGVHSSFVCFPKATYLSEHPEWYNAQEDELCYTAHGDAESLELMKEVAFEYVKKNFVDNKRAHMITFSHQDTNSWCYCTGCSAVKAKYKANVSTALLFINDLANRVEAWMETPEGLEYKRDFKITFLAYTSTQEAPVNYDEKTDTYTPIDENIICGPHVQVMFAPINMDFQSSLYDEINISYYDNFRAWRVLCNQPNTYTYHAHYNDFLSFYDSFEQMQEYYIVAANSNTHWLYDLGQSQQTDGATGWNFLKVYLSSKFGWNVNYNFDELVNKFFKGYYGPASDVMLQIFNEQRARYAYNLDNQDLRVSRSVYKDLAKEEYWPKNLLDKWVSMYGDALNSINSLQYSNPQLYQLYSKNIRMERLSIYYTMVEVYEATYSKAYMLEVKNECRDICELSGIIDLAEGDTDTLVALWSEWGIL